MPRYGEFGGNAFIASLADAHGYVSTATAEGQVFLLACITFERGGAGIFLFEIWLTKGIVRITRVGPDQQLAASDGRAVLRTVQRTMGGIGVRLRPLDAFTTLAVVVDNMRESCNDILPELNLKDWFPAVRAFLTSMHGVMVKQGDHRYSQGSFSGAFRSDIKRDKQDKEITLKDLRALAVQCPYLHMTGEGRRVPDRQEMAKIAQYMAWWRSGLNEESEVAKGESSLRLCSALLSQKGERVYLDFLAATRRCYEEKLDNKYRAFLSSAREAFRKSPPPFLPSHMSDVILPQTLVDDTPMPIELYQLISPEKSRMFSAQPHFHFASPRFPSMSGPGQGPLSDAFSPRPLSSAGTPRSASDSCTGSKRSPALQLKRARPRPSDTAPSSKPALPCYPWLTPSVDSLRPRPPADLKLRNPQVGRVLMSGVQLASYNELTGYAWPELETTRRGASREAGDDAAGICLRGTSHRVVSAAPGARCQPYKRLIQGEKRYAPDNEQAEQLHRLALATTQQRYLRDPATRDNFFPSALGAAIPVACTGRSTCTTAHGHN